MSVVTEEAVYTLQGVQEMLGVTRGAILGFVRAGFVSPSRGPRNNYLFGFQDVVIIRTAQTLKAASVPVKRIQRSLQRLRASLPATVPLSGLRITAVGDDVVVREAGQDVALDTGQLLLDFQVSTGPGAVLSFPGPPIGTDDAVDWNARGAALEGHDAAAAIVAYRQAIEADPALPAAYLSLGALLHESGELVAALSVYDAALARSPLDPDLHYNRAIVLEDLTRPDDALRAYEDCLRLAPDFADAHWNVARLHEQRGAAQQALRHFSAFRRLER